jgi:hypothetical protein
MKSSDLIAADRMPLRTGMGRFRLPGPVGVSDSDQDPAVVEGGHLAELARDIRRRVIDAGGVLDELCRRATQPDQSEAARALLEKIRREVAAAPPKFVGLPALMITREPQHAFRAHGDLDDAQEIPAGSVLLSGTAAPGGATQFAHLGQCPDHGPVLALPTSHRGG